MLSVSELVIILVVGAIIFFFGKNKVMEWINAFKSVQKEVEKK